MASFNLSDVASTETTDGLTATELLGTNWQTTAAVGLTVASAGVGGAIMLAAFPAQTLVATGTVGALAYTGKRRADGLDAIPFMGNNKSEDKASDSDTKTEVEPSAA